MAGESPPFFTEVGYTDVTYTLCEGNIPCAVVVIRKKCAGDQIT